MTPNGTGMERDRNLKYDLNCMFLCGRVNQEKPVPGEGWERKDHRWVKQSVVVQDKPYLTLVDIQNSLNENANRTK